MKKPKGKGKKGSREMEAYLKAAVEAIKRGGVKGGRIEHRRRSPRSTSPKVAYEEGGRTATDAAKKYDAEIRKIK